MKKKNLSILTISLASGGAERVISLLLKYLVEDYNVTLVLFYNHIHYKIPDDVTIEVLSPNSKSVNSTSRKIKDLFSISKKYNSLIRERKIDISMAFLALPNIINGIMAMRNKNLRTIISERCFPSIMYKENKSSQLIAKYAFPLFYSKNDHLFSNSIYINKDLKENFSVKMPMSVIYNPIDIDETNRKQPNDIQPKNTLSIINVGSIYEPKNQKMILNALSILDKDSFQFIHAGTGVMEKEIKKYCTSLNLDDNVTFLGKISNVKEQLIKCDCFVLSSKTEGFPNVVLEAMAAGLPVISTNCMSGPLELLNDNIPVNINEGEFVEAKYGLLINVDDEKALAKALEFFRVNHQVRQKYCEIGFERAKQNQLPNIYDKVKTLLNA